MDCDDTCKYIAQTYNQGEGSNFHEDSVYIGVTNIKNLKNVNKITGIISNKTVDIMIDTGSTVNAISDSLVKSLKLEVLPLSDGHYKTCTLANGARTLFKGIVSANIGIGNFSSCVTFYVLSADYNFAILGCDFLSQNGVTIDFDKKILSFNDAHISFISDEENTKDMLSYTNIAREIDCEQICDELQGACIATT